MEWLASANQPSSYCFEGRMAELYGYVIRWFVSVFMVSVICSALTASGVDIWIENVQGECLRIREHRQVKVGHVAVGISDQVRDNVWDGSPLCSRKQSRFDPLSHPSFRSQGKPSRWRPWTGRWCLLNKRSRSLVCGSAVFPLRTDVSAGGGESKTGSWSCENETSFFCYFLCCSLH